MSGKDLLSILTSGDTATSLKAIWENHSEGKENNPPVGCDVSIWINAAMRGRDEVIEQFHSNPKVPIVAVGIYVRREQLQLFSTAKFLPVLVFDGLLNPSKKVAHASQYSEVPDECKENLQKIYRNEIEASCVEVLSLQKKAAYIRNDILHTILQIAEEYIDDV
jgi:1-acyl-sn-glycerol-3-phosphate acyltransferase